MKGFGYAQGNDDLLQEMAEISIVATPNELRDTANFLLKCADNIEADPYGWEHEHLADEYEGYADCVDIVVSNGTPKS